MILSLLFACITDSISPQIKDREAYLDSLRSDNPTIESCRGIQDTSLQGECLLFLASRTHLGFDACDTAQERRWKDACYFEVIDKKGLSGPAAKRMCLQTGSFQARCMYHILQREEKELMQRFPSGKEQALMQYISEQIQTLNGAEIENDPLSHSLVARILARRFRNRGKKDNALSFSTAHCGNAPSSICQQAYRFVIKLEKRIPRPCRTSPIQVELKEQGFPLWAENFSASAQKVWQEICFNQRVK